jgi:Na+/proline symporter
MASTAIADFVRPIMALRTRGPNSSVRGELLASRLAVIGWAVVLAAFASLCVFWQRSSGETLIEFALGVMVFAYGGLLGVFLTAILTRRGSSTSALAALVVGLVTAVVLDPVVWSRVAEPLELGSPFAFTWRMTAATIASVAVCCARPRPPAPGARSSAQLRELAHALER